MLLSLRYRSRTPPHNTLARMPDHTLRRPCSLYCLLMPQTLKSGKLYCSNIRPVTMHDNQHGWPVNSVVVQLSALEPVQMVGSRRGAVGRLGSDEECGGGAALSSGARADGGQQEGGGGAVRQ